MSVDDTSNADSTQPIEQQQTGQSHVEYEAPQEDNTTFANSDKIAETSLDFDYVSEESIETVVCSLF